MNNSMKQSDVTFLFGLLCVIAANTSKPGGAIFWGLMSIAWFILSIFQQWGARK